MFRSFALFLCVGLALLTGCSRSGPDTGAAPSGGAPAGKRLTIAFMPKSKGNGYFVSCKQGADQAAKDLGAAQASVAQAQPQPQAQAA